MLFWTNQTIEAWEKAKESGYLSGNLEYVWDDFKEPYRWMMVQMKKRLPNYAEDLPIWLWTERPDLRSSGHFDKGTQGVCLTVNISIEEVLFSDFDAWHSVLNDSFLALSEDEYDLFAKGMITLSKEESWERIFELKELRQNPYWGNGQPLHIQGVTGRISINQVKNVKNFIAR